MAKYRRNYIKELWWNRPWVFIPGLIRTMKLLPWEKKSPQSKFRIWLRNMFYLSWQTCLEKVDEVK